MSGVDFTSVQAVMSTVIWWHPPLSLPHGDPDGQFTDSQKLEISQYLYNIMIAASQSGGDEAVRLIAGMRLDSPTLFVSSPGIPGISWPDTSHTIGLNLNSIPNFYYFNTSGNFIQDNKELTLLHELSHAYLQTEDFIGHPGVSYPSEADFNDASFSYNGTAVDFTNSMAAYLGLQQNIQASYWSELPNTDTKIFPQLSSALKYSEDKPIDYVRYGDYALRSDYIALYPGASINETINMRGQFYGLTGQPYKEMIFGFSGIDHIYAGGGNDYIYAGIGDDVLLGGGGSNLLDGGQLGTAVIADGTDIADYSGASGITVILGHNTTSSMKFDGQDTIIVSDNGQGGTDRLVSIEKIIGSATGDDRVIVTDTSLLHYQLTGNTLVIDGMLGGNTIDFSAFNGKAYLLQSSDGTITVYQDAKFQQPTGLVFKHFTDFIGTNNGDVYKFDSPSAPAVRIHAGLGNDLIQTANVANVIDGGGGTDTVVAAATEQAFQGLLLGIENYDFVDTYGTGASLGRAHGSLAMASISVSGTVSTANPTAAINIGFADPTEFNNHSVSIQHIGINGVFSAPIGTLLITSLSDTSDQPNPVDGTNIHSGSGNVSLAYALDPGALAAAPKGTFSDDYSITLTDSNGNAISRHLAITVYSNPASALLSNGQTTANSTAAVNQADLTQDVQTTTGSFSFLDSNSYDVHHVNISFVGNSLNTTSHSGTFDAQIVQDTPGSGTGSVSWQYLIDETTLRSLPSYLSSYSETYQVQVDDGRGGIVTQNLTLTSDLTRAPTLFAPGGGSGSVRPLTTPGGIETTTGLLSFSDADLRDAHTVSVFPGPGAGYPGLFSAELVTDSTGVGTGQVRWTYTVSDADLANAFHGSSSAEFFTVTVDSGRGAAASTNVTVSVQAEPNFAPTITGGPQTGSFAELATTSGSTAVDQVGGSFAFADINVANRPVVSLLSLAAVWTVNGAVMAIPAGTLTALKAGMSAVLEAGHTNNGIVDWKYAISDGTLDFLGQGDTLVVSATARINDLHLGFASTPITVTITGANDGPATVSADTAGSVAEQVIPSGSITTSGAVVFADADVNDIHLVTPAPIGSPLGTLTVATDSDTTGTGTGGHLTWTYSVAAAAVEYLGAGETRTESFTVSIDDQHGGIVSRQVDVTITGTNDAPVVTPFQAGAVTQAAAPVTIANPLSHASDSDLHDVLSLVANSEIVTSSDGHAVAYSVVNGAVTIAPSQFAYLGAGQHVDLTLGYDVTDGTAVTHGTVTLEVIGLNEKPTTTTSVSAIPHNETSSPDTFAPVTGYFSATDPDGNGVTYASGSGALIVQPGSGLYTVNALGEYTYFYDTAQIEALKSGGYGINLSGVATDTGGLRSTSVVNVLISGSAADDAPFAMAWSNGGSVLDHPANGTIVGALTATDPDGGDASPWSLVDDAGGRFAINAVTGFVTVANGSLLDYATAPDYTIIARKADGSVSDQETMHVSLIQVPTATLTGTSGNDTLTGTSGNDVIIGLDGVDTISAGSGDDFVMPGSGQNFSDGGAGTDTISFADLSAGLTANLGTGAISGAGATGTASNFENIIGSQYDDQITGTSGANVIQGGGGNDAIRGNGGNDTIDGGLGTDILYFDILQSDMTANLQTQTLGGAAAGTTIVNVEGVISGNGNDSLTGFTSAASYLQGGAGNDILIGGTGADTEKGDAGHDIIYGTLGADWLYDPDDAVFDYSGSPTGVALIAAGSLYLGYGGFAEADHVVVTGGSASHYEFDLTPFNDIMSLVANTSNTIYAGAGDDLIVGSDIINTAIHNVNTLYGGAGFDTIHPGGDGYDTVDFGTGGGVLDYALHGAAGSLTYVDFEWAEPGGTSTVHMYNVVNGSTTVTDFGTTTVAGDFGTFVGTAAADIINGNSVSNTLYGGGGLDVINGGGGNDAITGIGTIHGNDGNDTIVISGSDPTSAAEAVYGDAGNDTIILTANSVANVAIYGGAGDDYVDVSSAVAGVVVHGDAGADIILANSAAAVSYGDSTSAIAISGNIGTLGDAAGDVITGAPKVFGSSYGDNFSFTAFELHLGTGNNTVTGNTGVVYGNTGNDTLVGTSAADVIHGGGGNDVITGGAGADTLFADHPGGAGSTQFNYSYGDGADNVTGFLQGQDSFNFAKMAGKQDPVVTISQVGADTDVHVAWYDIANPTSHVDADIILAGVHLTTFQAGHDYFVV